MRHAWLQAASLGVGQEVLGGGLGAGIKAVGFHLGQHVVTHRDRALVDAEHLLEVFTQHHFGDVLLARGSAFVFLLEHRQGVDVVGEGFISARERYALIILAGDFLGRSPFGLGPVTHDLHAGLAVDDLASLQVPVLALAVDVHVGRDFLQFSEGLDHFRAGQCAVIQVDQGFLVAIGAHHREHHRFEHGAVLPRLAAVGERNEACSLELVARCIEFFEGGWVLGDAGFLEDFRVDPQPVHAVDIHRHCHVVTVVFHGVGDFLVEQRIPFFFFGDVFEHVGVEQASRRPFLDVGAFDLGNAWRVTSNRAAFEHGHGSGATAACYSTVFPGKAVFLNLGLQDIHSRFFTARGPPMHHFHRTFGVGGKCTEGEQRGNGNSDGEAINRVHLSTFSCCYACKSRACAARSLNMDFQGAGNKGTHKCHHLVT